MNDEAYEKETQPVDTSKLYSEEWYAQRDARIDKVTAEGKRIRRRSAQARTRSFVPESPGS
jgi:hypothetical protein